MQKAYSKTNWENSPSDNTPLNEANLNHIESGIDEIDNRVISLDTTKFDKTEAAGLIKSFELDKTTGIIKITKYNGSIQTIDTLLEKIAVNFDFDETTQHLIITLDDGTTKEIDLSSFITQYEFLDSDTIAFTVDSAGKVKAIVKEGSIEEKHLQPNYLADIKIEAGKAEASKTAAALSEANSKVSEENAKTYETNARTSEINASASETNAAASADVATKKAESASDSALSAQGSAEVATQQSEAAKESASAAKSSEDNAKESEANSKASEANAKVSEMEAAHQATAAEEFAIMSKSYADGDTGAREGEELDNAKYYKEQSEACLESAQQINEEVEKIKTDVTDLAKDYFERAQALYNSMYLCCDGETPPLRVVTLVKINGGTPQQRVIDGGISFDGGTPMNRLLGA